jgi:hypothetical protein
MKAKRVISGVSWFAGIALVVLGVRVVAFYTVPPDCSLAVRLGGNGMRILAVRPNFVVNSVDGAALVDPSGAEHSLVPVQGRKREFMLAAPVVSGSRIAVSVQHQYDRIVPSITTVTKEVLIP